MRLVKSEAGNWYFSDDEAEVDGEEIDDITELLEAFPPDTSLLVEFPDDSGDADDEPGGETADSGDDFDEPNRILNRKGK